MSRLSTRQAAVLMAAALAAAPSWAALAYTDGGSVTSLEGGWTVDSMSIAHSAPLVNPDFCSVTNAGYATNPADSGHSLFHTMLLGAFQPQGDAHAHRGLRLQQAVRHLGPHPLAAPGG